jgi:hypothetical protein
MPFKSFLNTSEIATSVIYISENIGSLSGRTTRKRGGLFFPKRLTLFNQIRPTPEPTEARFVIPSDTY